MRSPDLHPQLAADCEVIGRFKLSWLLLMRDANYPWLILVPDRADLTEIYQLNEVDQQQFMRESAVVSRMLYDSFKADKINIATLGNIVPQLHIHHVARYKHDPAWPAPIWGNLPARPYDSAVLRATVDKLVNALAGTAGFSPMPDNP